MPCPYSVVCKDECPGGEDFEPEKGVLAQDNGIKCLDFDILLTYDLAFKPRKLPGPRHLPDIIERMDKVDASAKKYAQSPKGKAAQRKWYESEKGQKSVKKHQETVTFKLTQLKYRESKKGKDTVENRKKMAKMWRKINRWLRNNPSKSYEDYFKEHSDEKAP